MNDRFDAQLREHLLATADANPADGQLSAVLRSIGGTAQRHPLAARLTWFPGRIGPVQTRTLRFALVAAALIGAMVAAALYVGSGPARSPVFEGTWQASDATDGSDLRLVVGAGRTPTVQFVDLESTVPACLRTASKVFTANGTGVLRGKSQLFINWPTGGGCDVPDLNVAMETWIFEHDEATDTIVDRDLLRWERADGAPTRGPVVQATEDPSASPVDDECAVVEPGGAYGIRVGSQFVTLTTPLDRSIAWVGRRDTFELSGSCLSRKPVVVRINIVTTVYEEACDPSSGVAVANYADAVQKFGAQRGRSTIELPAHADTVGGYPAAWFHVEYAGAACDGLQLWNDVDISDGDVLVWLLDVDGVTLGIALWFRDDPNLNGTMRDTAETMIYGIQVTAALGPEATDPPAVPECIQFDSEATYTRTLGGLPVSLTVPGTAIAPWSGYRDEWALRRARCGDGGWPSISATIVTLVYADACRWTAGSVRTRTAADVVAALLAQTGHDTSAPIELTLGGHAANRIDFSLPAGFDRQACDSGDERIPYAHLWDDEIIVAGSVKQVYVVDADGRALVLAASYDTNEAPPAAIEEIDAIMATLSIGG